jgi:hypothetical protein
MQSTNEDSHSPSYNRLKPEQKEIADTILSFLNGQNTKSAERILSALIEEITFYSEIKS